MSHYALIGHPLGHSLSKSLFDSSFGGAHSYHLLDIDSLDNLRGLIDSLQLSGFNVTIPYKQKILPLLDRLTPEAEKVRAVNCVRLENDGSLTGHNTDSQAFAFSIQNSKLKIQNSLILGTGGAARAVASALRSLGIEYCFVSRQPNNQAVNHLDNPILTYDDAYKSANGVELIVNATPVGMTPLDDKTPWVHPELFSRKHLVYDLIYNPSPTRLMRYAASFGAQTKDGLAMLRRQAELSWNFWGIIDR